MCCGDHAAGLRAARTLAHDASMPAGDGHGFRAHIRTRARDWDRRVAPLHVFGGRPLLDAELPLSATTGRPLPLAFDFDLSDPRLADLGIRSVKRLAVLAPYGIDVVPGDPLVVRHADEGRRLELLAEPAAQAVGDVPELPQLPVEIEPLSDAEVACETVDEFPDDHGPLHQVGGHAVWLTRPVTPSCPVTGRPMRYVATVDSIRRHPIRDADVQLTFGNMGMLYVFWSDEASISAAVVQSW